MVFLSLLCLFSLCFSLPSLFIFFVFLFSFIQLMEGDYLFSPSPTWPLNNAMGLMTLFLSFPFLLSSLHNWFTKSFSLGSLLVVLIFFLLCLFSVKTFFGFYVCYELTLFPIVGIIFFSGGQKKRGEAGLFLLAFATFSSLLLLITMFYFLELSKELIYMHYFCPQSTFSETAASSMEGTCYCIMLTFLVKFPAFFFHMWLPKAHVEAPVTGSMILAGVLLKMGGVGIWNFKPMLLNSGSDMFFYLISFFAWGSIYVGVTCFQQKDFKLLIALSSVHHMGLILMGFFQFSSFSLWGSLYLLVGHGFMSSLIFYLSSLNYSNSHSRSLFILPYGGGKNLFLSLFWVGAIFINTGFPPFLNFSGELLLMSCVMIDFSFLFAFFLNFFLSGVYAVALLSNKTSKFQLSLFSGSQSLLNGGEFMVYLISLLHFLPLFFFSWKIAFFF